MDYLNLIKKRDIIKMRITKLKKWFDEFQSSNDLDVLKIKYSALLELEKKFDEC